MGVFYSVATSVQQVFCGDWVMKRYCYFSKYDLNPIAAHMAGEEYRVFFEVIYNVSRERNVLWSDYIQFSSTGYIVLDSVMEEPLNGTWTEQISNFDRILDELEAGKP